MAPLVQRRRIEISSVRPHERVRLNVNYNAVEQRQVPKRAVQFST